MLCILMGISNQKYLILQPNLFNLISSFIQLYIDVCLLQFVAKEV